MNKPTDKQMALLKVLIEKVEPEMVLPANLTKHMASARIAYLTKKMSNPGMAKKYMT